MNKLITILMVAAAIGAYAERPPSPGAYRHNAEVRQKQNKEQEKTHKNAIARDFLQAVKIFREGL